MLLENMIDLDVLDVVLEAKEVLRRLEVVSGDVPHQLLCLLSKSWPILHLEVLDEVLPVL